MYAPTVAKGLLAIYLRNGHWREYCGGYKQKKGKGQADFLDSWVVPRKLGVVFRL